MMQTTPQCILKIRQAYPNLHGKYLRIADYILANPDKIITDKVKDIAKACDCDDSQIIRFCQKLGLSGFSEMRTSLASEFLPVGIGGKNDLSSGSCQFAKSKEAFMQGYSKTLNDTISRLDEKDVSVAVDKLRHADKIYFAAVGASGIVAMDAQIKLIRLGYNAVFLHDSALLPMMSGLTQKDNLVVAISYGGESKAVVEFARNSAKVGAYVVALTCFPDSAIAREANLVLLTVAEESHLRTGAMTSRIAQCLVLDFIIMRLVASYPKHSSKYIIRTHQHIFPSE